MKKILGICLTIVLCFIFTSCQPTNIQTIDSDDTTPHSVIMAYNYEAFSELPRIDINTENGIAIDDESLIDPIEKKGGTKLWSSTCVIKLLQCLNLKVKHL